MAAAAGEQVWESVQHRRKYHREFSKAAFWQTVAGTGFMKTSWDTTAYDRDAEAQGDIKFTSVQPYNLLVPDLLEIEIEDQPFVLEVQTRPVEWVNLIFKDMLEKPAVATTRAANSALEDAYIQQKSDNSAKPDSCFIFQMWMKPGAHRLFPQGGFVMLVNDEIVAVNLDGLPYAHKEYPYAKYEHIPTSKFYAASVIEDVINLQKEYNKIRSQIADNRRKTGNVQFFADKGSIIPEKVTNSAGQIVLVRPGTRVPTQIQPASIPGYVLDNLDRVLTDIEDISGQHQVSKGNVPPGITAATAISYLQERDDSLLTHTYQSIEEGTEKVARQTLSLAVQYWDEPRLIKTVGADGAFDTQLLAGSDLVAGTDIRIEAGSALPQSKAAKQALIMDFMKFGWIDPNEGLKMMEIGGAQKIFEQIRADERQAQRENIRMKSITPEQIMQHEQQWQQDMAAHTDSEQGIPLDIPPVIPVNSYDNHQVHIDVHNRYRRGQAFEMLPPEIKAQFEAHVEHHKVMLMQEQMGFGMMAPEGMDESALEDGGQDPEETGMTEMMQLEGGGLSG